MNLSGRLPKYGVMSHDWHLHWTWRVLDRLHRNHELCRLDATLQAFLMIVWPCIVDRFTQCPACGFRGCRKHQD